MSEKKYTCEQILQFDPLDWLFRRSSGFPGYDHKDSPNNESTWIYEEDYFERKRLKEKYEEDYKLLHDFRRDKLPFGKYPDYVIKEFLDKKYFKTNDHDTK